MASPPAPQPVASWWLSLASRLGRVAIVCLIVENFLLLLAPLAFLTGLNPGSFMTTGSLLSVFSDAGFLLSLADLFAVIGFTILAPAFFLILVGLVRSKRRVPYDSLLLGGAIACAIAVIPVQLYAHARAAGTVASLDAVAATGGLTAASALILLVSLLYLFFSLRIEGTVKPLKFASLKWPVYGAVNVFGSLAIAGFFQGLAAGSPNMDAFTIGLVVKMTLVPVLGVLAYRDLFDRFPNWARIPVAGAPILPAHVRAAPRRVFPRRAAPTPARPLPPPPSPENEMRPLPPPPTD
jgi:hypothetical protein